jgi:hypothetical protein
VKRGAGLLLLLTLAACSGGFRNPFASSDEGPPASSGRTIKFTSMGTIWTIQWGDTEDVEVQKPLLRDTLMTDAYLYDTTFSDWMSDSELRKLEKRGLNKTQEPTPLFMQGLRLSRRAFLMSDKAFDITIGAVLWKAASEAVGMEELEIEGRKFRFKKDPKRLTFGGIAKGMLTGAMALKLWDAGLRNFRVDGGGGNVALAGDDFGEAWPELREAGKVYVKGDLLFVSRSAPLQKSRQHILDPSAPRSKIKRQAEVVCAVNARERDKWIDEGGLTDALSTALVIRPDLRDLPLTCQSNISQSR